MMRLVIPAAVICSARAAAAVICRRCGGECSGSSVRWLRGTGAASAAVQCARAAALEGNPADRELRFMLLYLGV